MVERRCIFAMIVFVAISAPKIAFGANHEDLGRRLIVAAGVGNASCVAMILNAGANVNYVSDGYSSLTHAAILGNESIVKLLLSAGADIDHANNDGYTPLMLAVMGSNKDIALLLLNEGANVNAKRPNGESVLRIGYRSLHDLRRRFITNSGRLNFLRDNISPLLNHGAYPLSDDEIRSLRYPGVMRRLQTENSEKRCDALKTWCEYIDEEYDVPVDLQRLIVRDMLGANIDYSRRNVEHQWSLGSIASWFRKKMRWTI